MIEQMGGSVNDESSNEIPFFQSSDEVPSYAPHGKLYYRRSDSKNGMSRAGYAMFSDDKDSIDTAYPGRLYVYDGHNSVSIRTIDVASAWEKQRKLIDQGIDTYGLESYSGLSGKHVEELFNPKDIVDSAAGFDDENLVAWLAEEVLIPEGIEAITTENGAVVFNSDLFYQNPNILFQTHAARMDVPRDTDAVRYVYNLATESQSEFEHTVRGLAASVGLSDEGIRFRRKLKDIGRSKEKVAQDYGGDWGRLLDINGASLVFGTFEETQAAYDRFLESHADIIVRKKAKATDFGYRDFILNIRMSNGFIGELQLLDNSVATAKKAGGHKIYNEARKLAKFRDNREKYTAIFGADICESIVRLYDSLKAWSVEVYSSNGFEYDKPGLSARASATLRESNELSRTLRLNIPRSLSVGVLSTTDLPSSDGMSTASRKKPPSSVLMGISQISKYLTAIENSYPHNIASDDGTVNSSNSRPNYN